jgi:hypothetical protein
MISVNVRANSIRKTVNTEVTSTPKEVFAEVGVDTSSSTVNLDGAMFTAADYNKTFEQLGVADGASCNLYAVVKADGANA